MNSFLLRMPADLHLYLIIIEPADQNDFPIMLWLGLQDYVFSFYSVDSQISIHLFPWNYVLNINCNNYIIWSSKFSI